MTENMKKFTEAVSGESQDFIEKMNQMTKEEIIALAKDKGITLTEADFETKEAEDGALSDDELSAAAGGEQCGCFLGGGGAAGERQHDGVCACVAYGQGNGSGYRSDDVRCVCVAGGGGSSFTSCSGGYGYE